MSWIDKLLPPQIQQTDPANRKSVPEGLWVKCPACETVLYSTDIEANLSVCPKCSHHMRISARQRLDSLLDPKGRYEIGADIFPVDALKFKDSKKYPDRLKEATDASGESEALIVLGGKIETIPAVVACFEFQFMGGSMGSVVGERFATLVQREITARTDLLNCRTHAKTWDLLRRTKAPTVRIDLGYATNPGDLKRLGDPDFRETVVESLMIAIQRLYLSAEDDAKTGTLKISDLRRAGIRK